MALRHASPATILLPARWPRTGTTVLLALALSAVAGVAPAQDARHEWPEGSAMHTLYVESGRLQASRASLVEARAGLLAALGDDPADPSPVTRLVAVQHRSWLAYAQADCELAGLLTGAGGAWPIVHGLTCETAQLERRREAIGNAMACLRALPAPAVPYRQHECLQGLVDTPGPAP